MEVVTTKRQTLIEAYQAIRYKTEQLCHPLAIEDYVIQSIEDVSPPKWHLAHTTWFFETFLLQPYFPNYKLYNPLYQYLFNSYYQQIGSPYPRIQRGLLSRPTVKSVIDYRRYVDEHILDYINQSFSTFSPEVQATLELGFHHEQQHQELLLMDIKHNFSIQPDFPIYYDNNKESASASHVPLELLAVERSIVEIGHYDSTFCFDNELPRHQQILRSYSIANRLVTNGEYLEFMMAGGYQKPDWWLADGWDCLHKNNWHAPAYWHQLDDNWYIFTLNGLQEINLNEPVVHVSYYEADAYARFRGLRLPNEAEWEHYVAQNRITAQNGNFAESKILHPRAAKNENKPQQFLGDVWEWTRSSYSPYPGYQSVRGALGEYNGKFMSNQLVLRGGSCVTPRSHIRISYRNFFQPEKRWQFSGIRLASDV